MTVKTGGSSSQQRNSCSWRLWHLNVAGASSDSGTWQGRSPAGLNPYLGRVQCSQILPQANALQKSTPVQQPTESPLNPISFNFSGKCSKQALRSCVGVRRAPVVLFPPTNKKNDSEYPGLFLHLPDVPSRRCRASGETPPGAKGSHRTRPNVLPLWFTAVG